MLCVAGGAAMLVSAFTHWVRRGAGSRLRGHELVDTLVALGRDAAGRVGRAPDGALVPRSRARRRELDRRRADGTRELVVHAASRSRRSSSPRSRSSRSPVWPVCATSASARRSRCSARASLGVGVLIGRDAKPV